MAGSIKGGVNLVNRNLLLDFNLYTHPPCSQRRLLLVRIPEASVRLPDGFGMRWSRIWCTERSIPAFRSMSTRFIANNRQRPPLLVKAVHFESSGSYTNGTKS